MSAFPHLDELIAAGYGDIPQTQIPADWRTIRIYEQTTHEECFGSEHKRRRNRTVLTITGHTPVDNRRTSIGVCGTGNPIAGIC